MTTGNYGAIWIVMTVAVTCTGRATVTGTEQRPALPHPF